MTMPPTPPSTPPPTPASTASPEASSVQPAATAPPSAFVAASGFVLDAATPSEVRGHADFGPEHHTDQGVVHGGVYATIVEIAGGAGANAALAERAGAAAPEGEVRARAAAAEGRAGFAVGVHNATDFLRPTSGGRALVQAEPLHQGRTQQLWQVVITEESSGKVLARGQLRAQNIPGPTD
jgi:1,4-dihydroxy-2-naphthoyl-CoA hydrolase